MLYFEMKDYKKDVTTWIVVLKKPHIPTSGTCRLII